MDPKIFDSYLISMLQSINHFFTLGHPSSMKSMKTNGYGKIGRLMVIMPAILMSWFGLFPSCHINFVLKIDTHILSTLSSGPGQ